MSLIIDEMRVCNSFWVRSRWVLLTRLMTKVALRGSTEPPPKLPATIWPPKVSTPRTSFMACNRPAISRVTLSVSASSEPGGNSIASSMRL